MKMFFPSRTAARAFKGSNESRSVVDCGKDAAKRWAVKLNKEVK